MPRLLFVLTCLVMFIESSASGDQTFPYKADVAVEGTEVFSGPGHSYYPTDKLPKGEIVEVYRHDPGGWCVIRPPEGSFSWISDQYVKLGENNLASVAEEGVGAHIGSRLSDAHEQVQVYLHKNETVEILGSRRVPGSGAQIWHKIAPPKGEFRWVQEKYLERDNSEDDRAENVQDAGENKQSGDAETGQDSSPKRPDSQLSDTGDKITAEEFQDELERIELELSMMVVEEPSAWSFGALRIRAETMLDRADTAEQRGNARLLLNKIARFEDIKQRYDSVAAVHQQNAVSSRFLDGLKRTMEKAAAWANPEGQFDGVGQLQQVFSDKIGAPRYALVDEAGNVRYYVTPAPGVNLQSYVGRQVGVTGTRGYMPEQKAQHIMARHVTSLENRIR
jgi:hypothetical protein